MECSDGTITKSILLQPFNHSPETKFVSIPAVTPILNLPQSGVLGMHNIVSRPYVINNEIKIRPIMYLALSYDHRIIDGKEAVSFLKTVKENLEEPRRLFLNL